MAHHNAHLPGNNDLMSDGIARIFIGKMPGEKGTEGIVTIDCEDPELKPQPVKKGKKNKPSPDDCKHGPPTSCFQGIGCRQAVKASFKQDDKVKTLCIMCPAKGTLRCSYCREARYCSQACLDHDKIVHKLLCESFIAGFKDSSRPTKHHVRILVFPPDKSAPEFFWAKPRTTVQGKSLEVSDADLANYMAKHHSTRHIKSVNYGIGLPPMGHGVNLHLVPTEIEQTPWTSQPLRKKEYLNKSIASLAPAGHIKPVYAHALAFAFESRNGTDMVKVQDMTFRDARHTIDSILQSSYNPVVPDPARFAKTRAMRLFLAIKSNKTADPSLIAIGITPDQETEEVSVALPPALRGQYRPSFFPFRVGLRYWAKIPTADEMSAEDFNPATFARWTARHSASYVEVLCHSDEEMGKDESKGRFHYVRHFVLATTTTVVHGSGAAIPVEHFKAFSAWDDLCEKHINLGDQMPVWPALVAEALGERFEEMVGLGQTREGFSLFWDGWKVHAAVPEMESPWDFEERHKNETVFMGASGAWTFIGQGGLADPKPLMEDLKSRALLRALHKCAANGERAIEVADHNGGRPMVIEGPTAEKDFLRDMQRGGINDRTRVVFDRGNM